MSRLYSLSAVEKAMEMYNEIGGTCYTLDEGCLGVGTVVCTAPGYKVMVVKETYMNEWSSGHKIRFYNEMPNKYRDMIERI